MRGSMRKMFCLGLAALSMGIAVPGTMAAEKAAIRLPQKMADGETVEVYYRKGLPVSVRFPAKINGCVCTKPMSGLTIISRNMWKICASSSIII